LENAGAEVVSALCEYHRREIRKIGKCLMAFRVERFLRGRTAMQWLDVATDKLRRIQRRIRLAYLASGQKSRLDEWIRIPGPLRWIYDAAEAQNIILRHPEIRGDLQASAAVVASGWADVPGFGRRRIEFDSPAHLTPEEAYAQRLLWRLDFLRPLVQCVLADINSDSYRVILETILRRWGEFRAQKRKWDTVDDSIRLLNLLEALALLQDQLDKEARSAALYTIHAAAWNIEIHRARTGNHLIYEGLALFAAGVCLPQHPRAHFWRRIGDRILNRQMIRQVRDDGMHGELCTNYHLITGTNFLKGWILARKFELDFPGRYTERLAGMLQTAVSLRAEDGGFISLGDSDRMAGFSREEREARAFAELGVILTRGSADAQSFDLEWLLGGVKPEGIQRAVKPESAASVSFGGYHKVSTAQGGCLLFDAGPFGLPGASHHGHADTLAFEVHLRGERFLVDPGGFSYVDYQARAFARSTAAHNTLTLDNRDSSQISGSFDFGKSARGEFIARRAVGSGTLLVGAHNGYKPLLHRRGVWLTREDPFILVLFDQITGSGVHRISAFFHADAGWEAQETASGEVQWSRSSMKIKQNFHPSEDVRLRIIKGQTEPEMQGWISAEFGYYVASPALVLQMKRELPAEWISVFTVASAEQPEAPGIDPLSGEIRFSHGRRLRWSWGDRDLTLEEVWN
jgi:hypothetical protein